MVVTGPAGSGRTTTIYGALHELASRGNLKIITAEDPVEYEVEGVLQQQVGPAEGVSYAQAIVAQMRQDPDVMMVGECRDLETLEGVLTVAMTGHLVLTTMHANDGPTCLRRILDFGIDPYRLAIAVIGVLAQRLVRRICPQCREQYEPPAWARQGLSDLPLGPMFKGKGCEACQNSGFRGRTVIAEMLEVDDATRLLIARNASAEEFRKQVSASGMRSLRAAGLARAPEGITTVDEVLRVCTG
ncbi:MAG: ATPase, T2SS/T4P/T4SS family [Planctomycetota bacterium]|nr:ATPase, T2SS/T4P/T4SS family [Planctomycetota bacterium]